MPQFAYKAKEDSGTPREGVIEASDRSSAALRLVRKGLFVSRIEEVRARADTGLGRLFGRRISKRDLAEGTRQLSDLLKGGLPLVSALEVLAREGPHARLRAALAAVARAVEEGQGLSSALEGYPRTFSPLYVSMVASGEAVGRLPEVLENLAERLEKDHQLGRRMRTALIYPSLLLSVAIVTVVVLVSFVVPRIAVLFNEMNQSLPLPTRMLVALSGWVTHYGWFALPVLAALVILARELIRRPAGRRQWDRFVLRLPVIGRLVNSGEQARFGRTMATLLQSGLSLLVALEVVEGTASRHPFREAVRSLRRDVAEGHPLSQAMRASPSFSLATAHVVAVGEDANDPATALNKVADRHEREVDDAARMLTGLVEPVLVIAVGLIVGFIVFSIMLPIFQIDISGLER